jgi:hypothetical protein
MVRANDSPQLLRAVSAQQAAQELSLDARVEVQGWCLPLPRWRGACGGRTARAGGGVATGTAFCADGEPLAYLGPAARR